MERFIQGRYNGKDYFQARYNGVDLFQFAFNEDPDGPGPSSILNTSGRLQTYYLADSNNKKIPGYAPVCELAHGQEYKGFSTLNAFPEGADRIIMEDTSGNIQRVKTSAIKDRPNLGKKLYGVGLLSDIHIDAYGEDYGHSITDFQRYTKFYNSLGVDFYLINGDLVNSGYEVDYQKVVELMNTCIPSNLPIKILRGNHECYFNGGYDASNKYYDTYIGQPKMQRYDKGNDVFLLLSAMRESGQNLDKDQTDWLDAELKKIDWTTQRVFLFTHYPYGDVGSIGGLTQKTQMQNMDFINLLKKYKNIIYFSGHSHTDFHMQDLSPFANIKAKTNDLCYRVHIPSAARPRYWDGQGLVNNTSGSQSYVFNVYEKGIELKGYDFSAGHYIPIACYIIEI